MILCAYFQDGEGFGCRNLELLEEIELITKKGKLPFILLADFNIEPEEWSKLAWLERNGAAIIRPEGVEATCRKGRGTLIDYAIVSKNIVPIIKSCQGVPEVPWAPHIGLRLVINAEPEKVLIRKLMRPRPVVGAEQGDALSRPGKDDEQERAREDLDPGEGRRKGGAIGVQERPEVWAQAVQETAAADRASRGPPQGQEFAKKHCTEYAEKMGVGALAETLCSRLTEWSRAATKFYSLLEQERSQRGRRRHEGSQADNYKRASEAIVRGDYPTFRWVPLLSESRCGAKTHSSPRGASDQLEYWRTVAVLAKAVDTWTKQGAKKKVAARRELGRLVNLVSNGEPLEGTSSGARLPQSDSAAEEHAGPGLLSQEHSSWVAIGEAGYAAHCVWHEEWYNSAILVEVASKEAEKALRKARAQAKEDWVKWVSTALEGGAGAAHRLTNTANALPALQLVLRTEDGFVTDPKKVTEHHAAPWAQTWEADSKEGFREECEVFSKLRRRVLETSSAHADVVDLSAAAIRKACRRFPGKTAIGLDSWTFQELGGLPDQALDELGKLLHSCIAELALPGGAVINRMVLLGKKAGGSRTIAIMTTFYRLLMALL